MGRWTGGQQNSYDKLFCWPFILSIIMKIRIVLQELKWPNVTDEKLQKLNCDIPSDFKCVVWPLQLLINNPDFHYSICGFFSAER